MALARENLAFGQMANSNTLMYAPSSATGLVHNILLHNSNSTVETVILNYDDGTNEYQIYEMDLAPDETVHLEFCGEGFVIPDAGDLKGSTTTAAYVTYKIDGSEETA